MSLLLALQTPTTIVDDDAVASLAAPIKRRLQVAPAVVDEDFVQTTVVASETSPGSQGNTPYLAALPRNVVTDDESLHSVVEDDAVDLRVAPRLFLISTVRVNADDDTLHAPLNDTDGITAAAPRRQPSSVLVASDDDLPSSFDDTDGVRIAAPRRDQPSLMLVSSDDDLPSAFDDNDTPLVVAPQKRPVFTPSGVSDDDLRLTVVDADDNAQTSAVLPTLPTPGGSSLVFESEEFFRRLSEGDSFVAITNLPPKTVPALAVLEDNDDPVNVHEPNDARAVTAPHPRKIDPIGGSADADVLFPSEPPTPIPPSSLPGTGILVQTPPLHIGVGGGGIDDGLELVAHRTWALLLANYLRDLDSVEVEGLETSVVVGSVKTGANVGQHDIAGDPPSFDSSFDVSELDGGIDPDDTDD